MAEQTVTPTSRPLELCQRIAQLARAHAAWTAAWRRLGANQRDPLASIVQQVESGKPLASVLAADDSPSSNMLRACIMVGESLNELPRTLQAWTEVISRRGQLKRRLWANTWYPALFFVLGWASVATVFHSVAPAVAEFYRLWPNGVPVWARWLMLAHQHYALTVGLVALVMLVPVILWVRRNCGTQPNGLPRDKSELYRRQKLACELMADMLAAGRPLIEVVRIGVMAAGGSVKQADQEAENFQKQQIVTLLGQEASVALLALRTDTISATKTQEHLRQLARQLDARAELEAARRVRNLPMALAVIAGVTIGICYVLLVYLPWGLMLRDVVRPGGIGM